MPPKYQVSQELVMCITNHDELIAVVRKNGELSFNETQKMGFDEIARILTQMTGQQIISKIPPKL